MRRADAIVISAVVILGGFVGFAALRTPRAKAPAPETSAASSASQERTSANEIIVESAALPAPVRDVSAIRQRILDRQHGTFIGEILAARDSNIARWVERRDNPIRVWIDERSPIVAPERSLATRVRSAFRDWGLAGVPLTFTFVSDSASADVTVTYVEHFEQMMAGRTLWMRDRNWWIVGGNITIALRRNSGALFADEEVYAIALHEVGHLLGLDHTNDSGAIMAPRVSVLSLSQADIATMRLIYEVAPGSVKGTAK